MRHQSNQWQGRRLSRTLRATMQAAAGMVAGAQGERSRRSCVRTCEAHTKELPACDHGRGKRGLQRDRRRLRGEGGRPSRERFARSGRARCACADERDGFDFSRSVVDKKGLSEKVILLRLAAATTAGPDFSWCKVPLVG